MPSIESRVKAKYGVRYWEAHKDEILGRANLYGSLDSNVPATMDAKDGNARDRRAMRRQGDRLLVIGQIQGQVKTLRQQGLSLDGIAQSVGLKARSSLYHYRFGEVKPTWRLRVMLERLRGVKA